MLDHKARPVPAARLLPDAQKNGHPKGGRL